MWSTSQKFLYIVELTVPRETAVGGAYEHTKLKCPDREPEAGQHGWLTKELKLV